VDQRDRPRRSGLPVGGPAGPPPPGSVAHCPDRQVRPGRAAGEGKRARLGGELRGMSPYPGDRAVAGMQAAAVEVQQDRSAGRPVTAVLYV